MTGEPRRLLTANIDFAQAGIKSMLNVIPSYLPRARLLEETEVGVQLSMDCCGSPLADVSKDDSGLWLTLALQSVEALLLIGAHFEMTNLSMTNVYLVDKHLVFTDIADWRVSSGSFAQILSTNINELAYSLWMGMHCAYPLLELVQKHRFIRRNIVEFIHDLRDVCLRFQTQTNKQLLAAVIMLISVTSAKLGAATNT